MSTNTNEYKKQVAELQATCQHYLDELQKKDQAISTLSAHIDDLTAQLKAGENIKGLLRKLYNQVDNKIITNLTTRGAYKVSHKKTHPKLTLSDVQDIRQRRMRIQEYDIREFFQYKRRARSSHLRPHYRLVAKAYRVSRDGGVRLAYKIHSVLKRSKNGR